MANTILEKLQEKYPNAEGINDARNIAEAVASINGVGGRGANAIADAIREQFTVTFNLNSGSGTLNPVTVPDRESLTFPAGTGLTPASGKEELLGWGAAADATSYKKPGETMVITENKTFYAIWGDKFTVTYDANGGTGSIDAVVVSDGTEITLNDGSSLTAPEDKEFAGWATTSSAEESDVTSPYTVTEDAILYAVWVDAAAAEDPET